MKERNGFVSNSSSSSFIISPEKFCIQDIETSIKVMLDLMNEFQDEEYKFDDLFQITTDKNGIVVSDWCDNSIPYFIGEFLEEIFDAHRWRDYRYEN